MLNSVKYLVAENRGKKDSVSGQYERIFSLLGEAETELHLVLLVRWAGLLGREQHRA